MLVSGGHTQLISVTGIGEYALLGESIDDAAGEAFDKTQQVAFHMMNRHRGHFPGEGQRAANSGTDQQRADQVMAVWCRNWHHATTCVKRCR
jgi:hypothetical protein